MFKFADKNAEFILNGDDDKLFTVTEVGGKKPIFFGFATDNDYHAEDIENNGEDGISCTLCFDNSRLAVKIPAIGNYMVSNALAAVAAGRLLGLSDEQLVNGVQAYKTVGSRANVINTGKLKIIDDCYNANPTSVKASLDTLKNFDGRKVAVLGDMKELGTDELKLHYETGEYAKHNGIDLVIAIGPLAKELAKGANGIWYDDIESACKALKNLLHEGDTVLVKASHSMQFEKIVEFIKLYNL
jgi:UDP-N-acetylmuramoyl-tripeptide--D-alanyl-D-alanine ligase